MPSVVIDSSKEEIEEIAPLPFKSSSGRVLKLSPALLDPTTDLNWVQAQVNHPSFVYLNLSLCARLFISVATCSNSELFTRCGNLIEVRAIKEVPTKAIILWPLSWNSWLLSNNEIQGVAIELLCGNSGAGDSELTAQIQHDLNALCHFDGHSADNVQLLLTPTASTFLDSLNRQDEAFSIGLYHLGPASITFTPLPFIHSDRECLAQAALVSGAQVMADTAICGWISELPPMGLSPLDKFDG
ncbi:hypothetical protein JB92DRAFT_2831330 [Gautieria morchelliformis]|nr:hypothetical protein JB92DRAFT_2831330 [Gautieria morchelliformis]